MARYRLSEDELRGVGAFIVASLQRENDDLRRRLQRLQLDDLQREFGVSPVKPKPTAAPRRAVIPFE